MKKKKACVLGGHGFIGHHIARRLKNDGWWVRTVDIAEYAYGDLDFTDDPMIGDLRDMRFVSKALFAPGQTALKCDESFDLVIQMAADMGGMGYLAGGNNDANVMFNSAMINLNVAHIAVTHGVKKLFYSSSACVYPLELQDSQDNKGLRERDAIPAHPDLCYGWEKLHSEILYDAFRRNHGLDVCVARFHNVFGIEGTWEGERAKAPAAICRKVAEAKDGGSIEIWGDGTYTRSFLDVDECVEGVLRLVESGSHEVLNIGSDEIITINDLARMVIGISGKNLKIVNVESVALGVKGRNSNNDLIKEVIGWAPTDPLIKGMTKLYEWVNKQVNK